MYKKLFVCRSETVRNSSFSKTTLKKVWPSHFGTPPIGPLPIKFQPPILFYVKRPQLSHIKNWTRNPWFRPPGICSSWSRLWRASYDFGYFVSALAIFLADNCLYVSQIYTCHQCRYNFVNQWYIRLLSKKSGPMINLCFMVSILNKLECFMYFVFFAYRKIFFDVNDIIKLNRTFKTEKSHTCF